MARLLPLLVPLLLGCAERQEGLRPVGDGSERPAEPRRFVRQLHLDLLGAEPREEALAQQAARLVGGGAPARAALVGEILAQPASAAGVVAELEGRLFAGQGREGVYTLLCAAFRNNDPTSSGARRARAIPATAAPEAP